MNCIKCGGAIPEEAKFCPLCGTLQNEPKKELFCRECGLMLEQGTMFCPVCGTPTGAAKSSAQAMPAAMPTASGQMNTVSAATQPAPRPAPAPQPAPAPTREPKPSDAVFGAFNSAYGSETKPSDIAFAKPSDAAFGAAPSAVSLEKPADFGGQTEQPAVPLAQTSLEKKGGKKWLAPVIAAAAAAVLVGGGALAYNFNKADVTNMIMGDSGYARMIEQGSVKTLSDKADNAVISKAAGGVLAAAASSDLPNSSVEEIGSVASDALNGTLDNISSDAKTSVNIPAVLEQLNSVMLQTSGYSGADVKLDVEAKITETLRLLITGGDSDASDMINEVIDIINSAELEYKIHTAKDSASFYVGVNDTSAAFSIGASGIVYSDGTVGLVFPGTSDFAIKYTVEQDGSVSAEAVAMPTIDEKEIERIKNELVDLYLSYYEKGEITIAADGSVRNITVKITSAQAKEMLQEAAALLAEDEYLTKTLTDYINANGGSKTVDDIKSAIGNSMAGVNLDENAVLLITTSVDKQNNIIAKKFAVDNAESYVEIGYKTEGKNTKLFFSERRNITRELSLLIAAENDKNGVITISYDEYENEKLENNEKIIIEIKYTDCAMEKFGSSKMLTGTFEIYAKKPISLDTSDECNTSAAILSALQSAKLTFSSKLENENTIKQELTVDVPQYASVTLKMTESLTNDTPETIPANALDANKIASGELTDDDMSRLSEMVGKLRDDIIAKCEKSGSKFADYIKDAADELAGTLTSSLTPKASEADINELNAMIDSLNDRCYSFYYNSILDEELEGEIDDLINSINECYLWGDATLNDLADSQQKLAEIEKELDELAEKVAEATKKAVEKQYGELTVDELESAKESLDFLYNYLIENHGAAISSNPTIKAAFEVVEQKKAECDDAYDDMEDMMRGGNIQLATIRKFSKAAAAFDIEISALYNLISQ